uniref:GPN-loop GTPase 2 n=2 Tax=Petromyzon marinus TaxID=7757 RepID=A0AAJ7XCN2_PETMA|nr:GPN-loop GTPase 2 [Petromyzon marinus]
MGLSDEPRGFCSTPTTTTFLLLLRVTEAVVVQLSHLFAALIAPNLPSPVALAGRGEDEPHGAPGHLGPLGPHPAAGRLGRLGGFGQAVIGPPGSGKTTYCGAVQRLLATELGRPVAVINLDPANDSLPYSCAVDISELVTLSDVMDTLKLGPNGSLIYCMEYLEANVDWLHAKLKALSGHYLLFDCPGQVELYSHHGAVRNVLGTLGKWDLRLCAVHLVDSHYCSDPGKFVSVLCTALAAMLHVELPHVNVLSKVDLIETQGPLAFNLDFYTEVMDMTYLLQYLADDPFFRKYKKLNEGLIEMVESYSLVSFVPLNVQDAESLRAVVRAVDKANGCCFGEGERRSIGAMMSTAMGSDFHFPQTLGVQERYVNPVGLSLQEELEEL